jgi:hypothetical protein
LDPVFYQYYDLLAFTQGQTALEDYDFNATPPREALEVGRLSYQRDNSPNHTNTTAGQQPPDETEPPH